MKRLSSGLRVSDASDDAAGIGMSERLRARIRSYDQARRNAVDGVSMLQVADGALGTVSDLLVRMRELAMQSRNGTSSRLDREAIDLEFQQLHDEIDRVTASTEFNGVHLLNGSQRWLDFQIGIGTDRNVDTLRIDTKRSLNRWLRLGNARVDNVKRAGRSLFRIDRAIERLGTLRGRFGAAENRLAHAINHMASQSEAASAAESRIRDVDVAQETARLTRTQILQQAATAMVAQANAQPGALLALFR